MWRRQEWCHQAASSNDYDNLTEHSPLRHVLWYGAARRHNALVYVHLQQHMDMGGAAATLGAAHIFGKAIQARATPAAPRFTRVSFVLALAENAIGSLAVKPNSVLKSHQGMTVQVGNTDAEGRLCLADTMSWQQRASTDPGAAAVASRPDVLIDVATLTGACVVALGEHTAGLFVNDDDLANDLQAAGATCSERLHPMPITPDHREALKCEQADTNSIGGKVAGACTAAAFLEKFVVEGVKWAHIDIAGLVYFCCYCYYCCCFTRHLHTLCSIAPAISGCLF